MEQRQWNKPKTKRDIASAQKKNHIFTCALELFQEYGYDNVTMKDIANRSGMSEGSIYHFFGSKSGILVGFNEQVSQIAYCHIEPTEQHLKHPCESIFEYLMSMGKQFEELGPDLTSRYYLNGSSNNAGASSLGATLSFRELSEFIDLAIEEGTLKAEIPAEEIVSHLAVTCNGLVCTWVLANGSFSLMELSASILNRTISSYMKNL